MEKDDFIHQFEIERARFDTVVEKLVENNDLITLVNKKWMSKDVIAHIVWYEKEMIELINSKSMTNNSEIWNNPVEKRNELVHDLIKNQSIIQVIEDYQRTGKELLQLFKGIDPDMYNDSSLYHGMPSEWVPHEIFRGNTYTHYPDHYKQLVKQFEYL